MLSIRTRPFLVLAAVLGASTSVSAQSFEQAISMVPGDAAGVMVVPSLQRLNGDMAEMMDRSGRGEAVIAGRPIDMLAAQLGLSAAFDERGSLAAWWTGDQDTMVFAIPVADAERFLNANLTRDEAAGEDTWEWNDELVHARGIGKHVLISTDADEVRGYQPGDGIVAAMKKGLGAEAFDMLAQADIAIWAGPTAIAAMQEQSMAEARASMDNREIDDSQRAMAMEMMTRMGTMGEGLQQLAAAVDIDALGVGLKGLAIFDPESDLGKAAMGGKARGSRGLLNKLPDNLFYMAGEIDIEGMGGVQRFVDLMQMTGLEDMELPAWVMDMGPHLQGVQFAAYPSKLGLAMGGLMNDSDLFVQTTKPKMARSLLEEWVKAADGVDGMIRRTSTWATDKELRKGGTADEFTIQEELLPKKERPEGSRSGDFATRKMMMGLVFGSRGMQGLAREVPDGLVVTFSRRPDVLDRATQAATGGASMSENPMISAMRGWFIENADMEMFIDVGQIGKLARQMMKIIPGAGGMNINIPEEMPPVGMAMGVDQGRVSGSLVIPSEVVGSMIGMAMQSGFAAP